MRNPLDDKQYLAPLQEGFFAQNAQRIADLKNLVDRQRQLLIECSLKLCVIAQKAESATLTLQLITQFLTETAMPDSPEDAAMFAENEALKEKMRKERK